MGGGTSIKVPGSEVIETPDQLAAYLGTDYGKIKYYYYLRHISSHYSVFQIPKKNGGSRRIQAPNNQLKTLQLRIAKLLKHRYSPKTPAKAFIDGLSIVDNAIEHTRRKFVFNIDLKDFFHSITFARVRGLLANQPYNFSPNVASVIAHLVTVNGSLPQGAPSSPILSNMICSRLDRELSNLAREHRAVYTRYADDITFSFYCPIRFLPNELVQLDNGKEGLSHYGARVGSSISNIVKSNGFVINTSKVRLQGRYEKQVVTGLVVNRKVNVDRRFVRKTCALIHSIERYGLEDAAQKGRELLNDPTFNIEPHVQGRVLFIKQVQGVDSPVYQRIAKRFNALSSKYKVPVTSKSSVSKSKSELGRSMMKKCWVINCDDIYSQGSGFMLENGLIATCAHIFVEEGEKDWSKHVKQCEVFRVSDKSNKHAAVVVYFDKDRDIALLRIDSTSEFEFLRLEESLVSSVDDEVSIWGFPNYKIGSPHVGRIWASVTNCFKKSAVSYCEVDKNLYSGNSGGPVLNHAEQVVGIAARGAVDGTQLNAFVCVTDLKLALDAYHASCTATAP